MFELIAAARNDLELAARDLDADALTGAQAVAAADQLGAIRRLVDGMFARVARRVAETGGHAAHGERSASQLCARLAGIGAGEVRRAIDVATRLEHLPETDAAVRDGLLSTRQAEMITSVAAADPTVERELLEAAADGLVPLRDACIAVGARIEDPAQRSRRQRAVRRFRMWTAVDGMVEGHFRVTPETGGRMRAVVDAETRRLFREARRHGIPEAHEAYAADVLAALVCGPDAEATGAAAGAQPGRRVRHVVHVVVDHAALVRGDSLPGERCEIPGVGPVNARWVQGLMGEAFVTAVVRKGRDIAAVAHLGRHLPAELRTAMIVGGRECEVVGCHARDYLELDHCDVDHAKGGPTARWNLAWLCAVHHRRKSIGWHLGPPDPGTGKRRLEPPGAGVADAA